MKIEGNRPSRVGAANRAGGANRAAASTAASSGHHVQDSAAVMGIPEAELTPKVRDAIMTLMEEVARLREELNNNRGRIQHLERLADQDSLLPVYNRRAFVRELTRAISMTERYGAPSTVIYFDVNNMKQINDTYGHHVGDLLLKAVEYKKHNASKTTRDDSPMHSAQMNAQSSKTVLLFGDLFFQVSPQPHCLYQQHKAGQLP